MFKSKTKSFTLSEMLVVMIITAIAVGMGFSVLRLVQKQIHGIQKNFEKSSTLGLFEQRIWQDFNEHAEVELDTKQNRLVMISDIDTTRYYFQEDFVLRNVDTIQLKLKLELGFNEGTQMKQGSIDAVRISGESELPDYNFFVSKKNDLTYYMNQDGF